MTDCYDLLDLGVFLEGSMHDCSLVDVLGALQTQALQLKPKIFRISTLHWLTECEVRKIGLHSLSMSHEKIHT